MRIFGHDIFTSFSKTSINLGRPQTRLNLFSSRHRPLTQDEYHPPQNRHLRFVPTVATRFVQDAIRVLSRMSPNQDFVPDHPEKITQTTLTENGRTHVVITMSDPDMLRYLAHETRSWQKLSGTEQLHLINMHGARRLQQHDEMNIDYTILAESRVNPVKNNILTKSDDHNARLDITKNIPFHLRRYVRVAPLTPRDTAFYNDPIFLRPPPKPNIYSYKVGDVIFLPVKTGDQKFTITHCHKFRHPYVEIRDEKDSIFNVPKGYVDRHNPPTRAKKIRDIAKVSALIAFAVVVPFASLILPLFMLKGRLRYLSAFFVSDFKARWRWNGRGFDFVLHPGCRFSIDPRDPDTEKYLGTENRYYHQYRQKSGVLGKQELALLLPQRHPDQVEALWQILMAHRVLTRYKSRTDEASVTQFTDTDLIKLEVLFKKAGLRVDERHLIMELFKNLVWQNLQKPEILTGATVPPPLIAIMPSGHIRLLEHHRIFGAMDFGLPIAVMVTLDEKVTLN